jgi:hypothetical protein
MAKTGNIVLDSLLFMIYSAFIDPEKDQKTPK